MKVFKHDFGGGITCELQTSDSPPKTGDLGFQQFLWEGKPTHAILPQYIEWMHSVNKQLANEWGIKFVYCFPQVGGPGVNAWSYEPSSEPVRVV